MKLKIVLFGVFSMFLVGCGAKKRAVQKKSKSGVVFVAPVLEESPYLKELKLVDKLEGSGKNLNKNILNYIRKFAPIAIQEMHAHKIPASITLAQGVIESGSGKSELASKSNNHFGIKCHTKWQGQKVYHDDDLKGECFRKYKYVATSYRDHSAFLSKRKRYAFLFDYKMRDYKKWAKGLKKAGYATDKKYPNKLISIIETYNLYEFDKVEKKGGKVEKETIKPQKPRDTIANYYEVEKGDTLYSISKKYNTSVAVLKEVNGLKDNTISVGQHLLTK
jgi:flagellum-specific peptidoglycan hydrolase FlgJ